MDNKKEIINSMNQLLQGEHMAVDTFNVFIDNIKSEEKKNTLKELQQNHRENISTLASYIQDLGGKPEEKLGLKGVMADLRLELELNDEDDAYIIKKAVDGSTKGINMAEKVLRGNLDDKSREISGEILYRDRMNVDRLSSLIQ